MANNFFPKEGASAGIGGLASIIGGLFNKQGKNPSDAANKYFNQIPGATGGYYNPYIQAGQRVSPGLEQKYGQLTNNPGDIYNQLGAGYQQSPGYQAKLKAGLGAAENAAAAGGTLGTPFHQQNANQIANDITNQDYEAYLNHIIGLFGQGLGGQQGIANRGYEAGTKYGDILGGNLSNQGAYAAQGQAAQNAGNQQNWSNIISGIGQFAPWLFGG